MWVRAVAILFLVPVCSLNVEMAYSEEEEDGDARNYEENDFKYSGNASTDTVILAWSHRPDIAMEIEQIKKANAVLREIFGTRILVTGAETTTPEYIIRYKGKFRHFGATPLTPTRTTKITKDQYPTRIIQNFAVTERKPTRTTNLFFELLRITRTKNTRNTEKEIKYTTVMMESTTEMVTIVTATIKRETRPSMDHRVYSVTAPTRTFMWTTNQMSSKKEEDEVTSPQVKNVELVEVQAIPTLNPELLEVKPPQTHIPGVFSRVEPTQHTFLDTSSTTAMAVSSKSGYETSKMQQRSSLDSLQRTPSYNIDVSKFMWLYNFLRKLSQSKPSEFNMLQQIMNEQESLKTSPSISDVTRTSNEKDKHLTSHSLSPLSVGATNLSVATLAIKQMGRSTKVTNVTTNRMSSRKLTTRHARRVLPARRTPGGDLPSAQSLVHLDIVAKCYVCGLTSRHIPEDSNCSDAFSRSEFLSLQPYDPRVKMQAVKFKRYCKYYEGYPWPFEHPEIPHTIFGEFTEGCSVRWTDATGAYTQRACRIKHNPMRGNHLASKRMAQLEYLLRHSSEGCIESPMATLLPLSRTISLFARFHACVCEGNWCNAGGQVTPRMVTILICSLIWKLL